MKKKFLALLLLPLTLTSCGSKGVSFAKMKEHIDDIADTSAKYPYYHVVGMLDFNNEILDVDAVFDQTPSTTEVIPYARYNEGFYNSTLDKTTNPIINSLSSRSYWLRAPLRITPDNYYAVNAATESEDVSCAHYIISHIITSFKDQNGSINPPSSVMVYDLHSDGSFSFYGEAVHSKVKIDNYPYYPDYNNIPELGEWDEENPLPCYGTTGVGNIVDAKMNIRFDYNAEGWLIKESLETIGYDYRVASKSQVSLIAVYSYTFA
jgi:hypothetical protein